MESATGAHRADSNDTTVWWYFIKHIASIKRSAGGTSNSVRAAGAAIALTSAAKAANTC